MVDARSGNSDIYAQRVNSNGSLTSVVSGDEVVPNEFALAQNYPNPFNPSTKNKLAVSGQQSSNIKNL